MQEIGKIIIKKNKFTKKYPSNAVDFIEAPLFAYL